ncbi:hypothetical protein ABZ642_45750 [Streptomyces sp. NPDC007157]|uniref:hypothetical protein n=1 Tax=Streptomyces sp. NPDC007157 TaxID=3154681 RepID=UPI0033E5A830
MHALTCATCSTGPGTEFRALPDGLFACPPAIPSPVHDIDLDGPDAWAIDASGILGYVTDPHHALDAIGEVLADLSEAHELPNPEYATTSSLRNVMNAFSEYTAAFLAGAAPVSVR